MATYIVTTLTDENDSGASIDTPGGTGLSLREAITLANADAGADTITFANNLDDGVIRLTLGTLNVTGELTIDGDLGNDGSPNITITGDTLGNDAHQSGSSILTDVTASLATVVGPGNALSDNVRIVVSSQNLTLNGLILSGGFSDGNNGGAARVSNSAAVLTVTDSVVSGNRVDSGAGGGVASSGGLVIDNTLIANNVATLGGGGAFSLGNATVTNSTISGNLTSLGAGGFQSQGDASLTNTTVAGNTATLGIGGVTVGSSVADHTLTITNSTITGNSATALDDGAVSGRLGSSVVLVNSIVLGNQSDAILVSQHPTRPAGTITLIGGNIVGANVYSGNTDIGDTTAADVFAVVSGGAGVLANNGGSLPTVALKADAANPAIDASNSSAPGTDARGFAYTDKPNIANANGSPADLGAYEVQSTAPSGADNTVTTLEGQEYVFTLADFGFSDLDGDAFAGVVISNMVETDYGPASFIRVNGAFVPNGTFITAAQISAGLVKSANAGNGNGPGFYTFDFQVVDDGGAGNIDTTPNRMTVDITPVNNSPSGANKTLTANEDTAFALSVSDFGFTDQTEGDGFLAVKITTLPTAGTLTNNGVAVVAGQFVSVASISAGLLKFTPALNANGAGYASFTFQVQDNGGTLNGGRDTDITPNTITFDVTSVNDAPTVALTGTTASIAENASTALARTVATIVITDDELGSEILSLSGADAGLFQIAGNALQLKAGAALDFETNPILNVTVSVNDPAINGNAIESSASLAISVLDLMEAVNGTAGHNILNGASNAEIISGLGGNDIIRGNGGDDRIIGGAGVDTLTGGAGRDVFVFASPADSGAGYSGYINNAGLSPLSGLGKRDIITDFTPGTDKIDLSAIDANTKLAGNQAFTFALATKFSGAAGQLIAVRFDVAGTANDKTIVYGDIDGNKAADFQIELAGLKALTAGDFIL